jgi:ABC-2 type transport system permease protein
MLQLSEEIYDSANRRHPLIEELLALIKYRDLIYQFTSRTLKARYKRSVLGVVWTMLNPLLMMVVLTLVFSSYFKSNIEHYPVYVLSGLMAWNFFSATTQAAMGEMVWSGALLNRIYVPKSVFAFSAIATGLINLGISLVPLLIIALILGVKIQLPILVLPLSVLLLAMFALGVGLILSAAAVFFADMLPVYEVVVTIWFYATPIIYPTSIIPERWLWLFKLNPLMHLIQIFRDPLFTGTVPGWHVWAIAAGYAVLTFILGGFIFTARANEYAYRI